MEYFINEKYRRALFDCAPIGIALVGPDGRVRDANHKLCEYLGYGRHELIGKTFDKVTHPEDIEADLREFNLLVDGKIDTYTMRKRYIGKYNDVFIGTLTVIKINDENRDIAVAGFVHVFDHRGDDIITEPETTGERNKRTLAEFLINNWQWFAAGLIAVILTLDDIIEIFKVVGE